MEKVKVQTNKRKEKINIVGKNETSGDCSTSKKELRQTCTHSQCEQTNEWFGDDVFFFAYCLIELLSGMTRFEHCFLAEALLTTKKLAELQCHV